MFCGEANRDKAKTLRIIGYAETTCVSGICRRTIYENIRVKRAISKVDDENRAISGWDAVKQHKQYIEDREFAIACKQPSAAISASIATARLYGMDKDAGGRSDDKALTLSKEALDALRAAAAIVNRQSIAKPTLYKHPEEA